MKKSLNYFILLLFLATHSFGQESPQKLIVNKWKLEENSIEPALQQRLKELKKTDSTKAKKIEDHFDSALKVMAYAVYDFKADGFYKVRILTITETATWQILEDNKTLIVKSEKIGERRKKIVSISKEKMVLKDEEVGSIEITYLAEN